MIDSYRLRMAAMGSYEGESRRKNSQKIMDASWMRDPATKPVYVKWVDSGLPIIDDDELPVYAKYNVKSYHNITGDSIAYLLQFRLEDIKDNPNINYIVSDICNLKVIENQKFDGIVLAYVLQHLSKQEVLNLFNEINNIVNDNSKLLIFLREGNGIVKEIEPIDTRYEYTINEYSKEEIKEILTKNGWNISLIETKEYIEDPNSLAPTTLVVLASK